MSTKNARVLGIRLDEEEARLLDEIEAKTTMPPVSIVRAAMKAVIGRWKQHKKLTIPFHLVDDTDLAKMNASTVTREATAGNVIIAPFQTQEDIALLADAKATGTEDASPTTPANYRSGIRKHRKK